MAWRFYALSMIILGSISPGA